MRIGGREFSEAVSARLELTGRLTRWKVLEPTIPSTPKLWERKLEIWIPMSVIAFFPIALGGGVTQSLIRHARRRHHMQCVT